MGDGPNSDELAVLVVIVLDTDMNLITGTQGRCCNDRWLTGDAQLTFDQVQAGRCCCTKPTYQPS